MSYLIGLDVGTSAVKALLLTSEGSVVGSHTAEYPFRSPQPGWTEQDPEDMWKASVEAVRGVLSKFSVNPEAVAGVGLSGQMHSSVFLDERSEVIRPAILWNDTRTTPQCRLIDKTVDPDVLREEACNPALEGFTLPKVLWLKENEPENFAKLRCLVLPKDYVRFRLTGNLAMEVSDAAGMLMMNLRKQAWSKPILDAFDLPADILPPIIGSSEVAGTITAEAAEATGLKPGTPVVGGGADNACGAVGSGVVVAGRGMVSLGTSGVILAHLAEPRLITEGTVHMFNSCVPGEFYMMGVTLSAGLSLSWLRSRIGMEEVPYDVMTKAAETVPPGSRGLVFLPYLTGERTPHGDGNARGSFVGLSAIHDQGDLVRAVLEGVAYAFCDSVRLLRSAGWNGTSLRALGGGAKSPLWKKIIASATGLMLEEINIDEGPGLGAAILAGVGTGIYADVREASDSIIKVKGAVEPDPEWNKVYSEMYQVYRTLYPALKPSFDRLVSMA